jgi:F-type H+-transporting ATPase subunit gamma
MSQRRQLQQRLTAQGEIGEILTSMKNLAYMETRKLVHQLQNQQSMLERIEGIAADFLAFYPEVLPPLENSRQIYLVIGSRRGLCGDFNARLIRELNSELSQQPQQVCQVIGVGHKLCQRLTEESLSLIELEGGDVAEELPQVLQTIVTELDRLQSQQTIVSLIVFYHDERDPMPLRRQLLPPFTQLNQGRPAGFPPLHNLEPRQFLLGLIDQYLYAALHGLLVQSLYAENEWRIRHLEGAVNHLEERGGELQRRIRVLRQEEIIEEIEVILLNAVGLDEPKRTDHGMGERSSSSGISE